MRVRILFKCAKAPVAPRRGAIQSGKVFNEINSGMHDRLLGFPFAKRLRNFCEMKRKIFLSLRISFARKNSNLRNHSQKSFRAKIALFRFFATGVLRNSAIPQFRYDHRVYFLELKCF